jgi:hypothetical protein
MDADLPFSASKRWTSSRTSQRSRGLAFRSARGDDRGDDGFSGVFQRFRLMRSVHDYCCISERRSTRAEASVPKS